MKYIFYFILGTLSLTALALAKPQPASAQTCGEIKCGGGCSKYCPCGNNGYCDPYCTPQCDSGCVEGGCPTGNCTTQTKTCPYCGNTIVCYCPVLPTAVPTSPPAPTSTPRPTPTRIPCGGPCSSSTQCDISCPICSPGGTCIARPTPTPTLVPCGGPCSSSTQCDISCPICTAAGICAAPTPTLVPCGGPCSSSTQCDISCPICSPGGICSQAPSCNCDGIDISGTFYSGTSFTVTGHAKVENPATNQAKVLNMVYSLYRDNALVAQSGQVTAKGPVSGADPSGTPLEKYSSSWSSTIPATGNYQVVEQINCGWKTGSIVTTPTTVSQSRQLFMNVNAPPPPSFTDSLINFLSKIFFIQSSNRTQSTAPAPASVLSSPTPAQNYHSIQLGIVGPTVVPMCHEVDFYVPL